MDGINPTLAFAALLFGLSNNARDAANDPAELQLESGCPAFVVVGDPPPVHDAWAGALLMDGPATPALPDVEEPQWEDPMSSAFELGKPVAEAPSTVLALGSDPIMRRAVPVAKIKLLEAAASDGCGPER